MREAQQGESGERFKNLVKAWEDYGRDHYTSSSMDTYVFNEPADELVAAGRGILPFMAARYRGLGLDSCPIGFAGVVERIAGEEFSRGFPQRLMGDIRGMNEYAVSWIEEHVK